MEHPGGDVHTVRRPSQWVLGGIELGCSATKINQMFLFM